MSKVEARVRMVVRKVEWERFDDTHEKENEVHDLGQSQSWKEFVLRVYVIISFYFAFCATIEGQSMQHEHRSTI